MTNSRPSYRLARSEGGFSLIEVVLALTVVVIGLVAVLGMLVNGVQSSRAAADNCIPAMIAQDVFSQIRADYHSYSTSQDLDALPSEGMYYDNCGVQTNAVYAYYRVNVTYSISPSAGIMPLPPASMVVARVTVLWPNAAPVPVRTNEFVSQIVKMR